MGIDVAYQAIPPDSELLARARSDPEWGSYLQFLHRYGAADTPARSRDDATLRAFVEAAQVLMRHDPRLRERRLSLDRRYDQLLYLLSPERRQRRRTEADDPLALALLGGAVLHPRATTTQGFPIRYLAPSDVETVVAALWDVDRATLVQHFDPAAMAAASVYKIRGDEDETTLQWLLDDFDRLTRFYELVAVHHEGVLTCFD